MSIDLIKRVKDSDILPSGTKFVAFCLADYADEEGKCYPSVELISKYTGQGCKTARDHLNKLEKMGVISRERQRKADGKLGRYNYQFDPKFISGDFRQWQISPEAKISSTSGENFHSPAADFAAHRGQLTPIGTTSINQAGEILENHTSSKSSNRFEEFWDIFNDKRGKQGAIKVWKRMRLDNKADQVIAGAKRYVQIRGENSKYWKQAQGWLNDGRWEDEVSNASLQMDGRELLRRHAEGAL